MAFFQPGGAKIRRLGVWRTTVRGTGFLHPCGNDAVLIFVRLPWGEIPLSGDRRWQPVQKLVPLDRHAGQDTPRRRAVHGAAAPARSGTRRRCDVPNRARLLSSLGSPVAALLARKSYRRKTATVSVVEAGRLDFVTSTQPSGWRPHWPKTRTLIPVSTVSNGRPIELANNPACIPESELGLMG